MDLKQYKSLVAQMLKEHFNRDISDTHLTDPTLDFARLNCVPAYQAVNQQAIELDLVRTDLANGNAYPRALLGNVDQYRAASKSEKSLVIFSQHACDEDGYGFWSNEFGWTVLDEATLFTQQESAEVNLPLCPSNDARWLTVAAAQKLFDSVA